MKDSPIKKAAKVFFAEDVDKVITSIGDEFVRPRAKSFGTDMILKFKQFMADSCTDFIKRIFFGTSNSSKSSNYYNEYNGYDGVSRSSYTSYATTYSDNYYYNKPNIPYGAMNHDNVRELLLPSEGKARDVLRALKDTILSYGFAYVADYYAAVSDENNPIPIDRLDYQYIWNGQMLDNIKPDYIPNKGWVLHLPKPVPKDK